MYHFLAEYVNDPISVDQADPDTYSSSTYMYLKLLDEGHDARLFRFSPSADGTIPGGHKNPQNSQYWQVGCLGITPACSAKCEAAFVECVTSQQEACPAYTSGSKL